MFYRSVLLLWIALLLFTPSTFAQHVKVHKLTAANFKQVALDTTRHVFVRFYASNHPLSAVTEKSWNGLAKKMVELPEEVVIAEVEATDENFDIIKKYNVRQYPSMVLFTKRDKTGTITFLQRTPRPTADDYFKFLTNMLRVENDGRHREL